MTNESKANIPRWAHGLGDETWERINELLYEGWQPSAVRKELRIPDRHKRSLELYARKYRHRRVLAPLARLSEVLASGMEGLGPDFVTLLRLCLEQALSNTKVQPRMAAVLGKIIGKMLDIGADKEEAEATREREQRKQEITGDAAEAMRQLLAHYDVHLDDGGKHE